MQIVIAGAPCTGAEELTLTLRAALVANGLIGFEVVLASGLIHAVTQNVLFGNPVGNPAALTHPKKTVVMTMLTGVDPSSLEPHSLNADLTLCAKFDAGLRQALDAKGVQYSVLQGAIERRTEAALQAIEHIRRRSANAAQSGQSHWHRNCGCCSDADCERQSFVSLIAPRSVRS